MSIRRGHVRVMHRREVWAVDEPCRRCTGGHHWLFKKNQRMHILASCECGMRKGERTDLTRVVSGISIHHPVRCLCLGLGLLLRLHLLLLRLLLLSMHMMLLVFFIRRWWWHAHAHANALHAGLDADADAHGGLLHWGDGDDGWGGDGKRSGWGWEGGEGVHVAFAGEGPDGS